MRQKLSLSLLLMLAIAGCSSTPVEQTEAEPKTGTLSGQVALDAPLPDTTVWLCLNEDPADFTRTTVTNPAMDVEYNFQKMARDLTTLNQKVARTCGLSDITDASGNYEFPELPIGMYIIYASHTSSSVTTYWSEQIIYGGNELVLDLMPQNTVEVLVR